MLADVLAGESPAGGGRPGTTVVISSDRKGDPPVGSLEVKAPVGWGTEGFLPGNSKDNGLYTLGEPVRSARGASNSTGRSKVTVRLPASFGGRAGDAISRA